MHARVVRETTTLGANGCSRPRCSAIPRPESHAMSHLARLRRPAGAMGLSTLTIDSLSFCRRRGSFGRKLRKPASPARRLSIWPSVTGASGRSPPRSRTPRTTRALRISACGSAIWPALRPSLTNCDWTSFPGRSPAPRKATLDSWPRRWEEFERLLTAAEKGKRIQCIAVPDGAMLYFIGIYTGYRRNEIGSVT
jgi:integrase